MVLLTSVGHTYSLVPSCLQSQQAWQPDVILHKSFTRPSTLLALIEGLETRLSYMHIKLGEYVGTRPG